MNFQNVKRRLKPTFNALGIDPESVTEKSAWDILMRTPSGGRRKILGSSTKVEKPVSLPRLGDEYDGVRIVVLYLAAATRSGINTCPWAAACALACLGHTTGHLQHAPKPVGFGTAQYAQFCKTAAFFLCREQFLAQLHKEIRALARRCKREGTVAVVRLNGSSDILWETLGVPQAHPDVVFYDYTKAPLRARRNVPENYHLTFSYDEKVEAQSRAAEWLSAGASVAVVVADKLDKSLKAAKAAAAGVIRDGLWGYPALDGDADDARFLDPPGSIVTLYAKGKFALADESGFVLRT